MPDPASQAQKDDFTAEGVAAFKSIEDGFSKLVILWGNLLKFGLISRVKHDKMVARSRALKQLTLEHHCDGTEIAIENDCDVPTTQGGGGGR